MEPTKAELKTLTTAIKVASRYGSEQQKEFNKKRVEKLAEKLKQVEDTETRKAIIEDIKNHNRKQSFGGVTTAIDDLVSKYNVKIAVPPSMEGAGAGIEEARVAVSKPLTPRMPEYKPGLRGKKPPPPPKETTAPPKPTLSKPQSKGVGKLDIPTQGKKMSSEQFEQFEKERQKAKDKGSAEMDKPQEIDEEEKEAEKEPEDVFNPDRFDVPPVEAEVEEEQMAQEGIATPPPPDKETEKPITRKVEEVKDDLIVDPNINPPSKKMGKSLQDLSVEEINKDLDYFYKNFKNRLKKLKRTKSKNLKVLQRFYRRVLALLRVEQPKEDKKIGIVIKGTDFIKNALKEIISENTIDGLSAEDLLINIEGKEDTQTSDAGAYQFKKGTTSGKMFAEQEPIARLIPTTDEKQVSKMNPTRRLKVNRIPNTKTEYRGLEKTAKKMVSRNPFLTANQPTIKLKKIY